MKYLNKLDKKILWTIGYTQKIRKGFKGLRLF